MVSSQVTRFVRPRTRELVGSGLDLGSLPFLLPSSDHCLIVPSRRLDLARLDFPGRWGLRTCVSKGLSAHWLAEGTLLTSRVGLMGLFLGTVCLGRSSRSSWVGPALVNSPYLAAS